MGVVTVGVLVSEVPRDAVDEAVAVCGKKERRSVGKPPAHVTAYLTLGLALFPDDDYEEVAAKVTGSPRGRVRVGRHRGTSARTWASGRVPSGGARGARQRAAAPTVRRWSPPAAPPTRQQPWP